jgi:23S rRNA (uridine2552-2'-O)-methyltransferase
MKRNKTSKAWLQRHLSDPYVRQARDEGYRSRAAFKLLEIAGRDHLLKSGMTVVDLGAAPGGWSQAAAAAVGTTGRVIAVDSLEMVPLANVTFVRGDFREPAVWAELEAILGGGRPDLVLSDMAPNLSGVAVADQARGMALAELAADFAIKWLQPDGAFLVKVFHGERFEAFARQMRRSFRTLHTRKPKASRGSSSEVYLLGRGPSGDSGLAREALDAPGPRCDSPG